MIRLAITDDDPVVREALSTFLGELPEYDCHIFESAEALENALEKGQIFDIFFMDIHLPGKSGIEAVKIIREKLPNADIVMLTIYQDDQHLFDSLCAGATGYLLKNTPLEEIQQAIENLQKGGSPMSPQIARRVIQSFNKPLRTELKNEKNTLSEREIEIVDCLVKGLSYKLIADQICISIDTVRFHIKNIYKKLHVRSKAEVITKSFNGEI